MLTDEVPVPAASSDADTPAPDHPLAVSAHQKTGGPNRKSTRPAEPIDERKKRKPGGERRDRQGFGDGLERAACTYLRHHLPAHFPVQHRTGVAALVPRVVARRTSAVLLCDCVHTGPHYWPDGDEADESED